MAVMAVMAVMTVGSYGRQLVTCYLFKYLLGRILLSSPDGQVRLGDKDGAAPDIDKDSW